MTLTIPHFDCRLNQWIYTIQGEILTEQLENTLLEKFFPDGSDRFSFGHIDEYSSPADLDNHPNGDVLLLASGKRLLYGPSEYLARIQEICPDPKDRGAYGSIFLGSCQANINQNLNILVVDDEGVEIVDEQQLPTGEWEVEPGANGGILPHKEAFKLVGDCHGKITPTLAAKLAEGKTNKVIQHRLRFGESRFGKGTIAPWDLANLPFLDPENQPHIDLVLPLSSFKGGDKKNNPLQPGLYENVTVWIGQKELSPDSNKSRTAISQVLATAPEGIVDFLPIVEQEARDLQELQNDPRWVAQEYIEDYEARMSRQSQPSDEAETEAEKPDAQLLYRLIKADLDSGHPKILETQKVQNELQRFLQNKWRDIATGKSIKFYRGMIIPSKNLREGEICDTRFVENVELLNFRSPYLNSNGMCVNINKYVPEAYSPTGETLEGVIVVSDETLNRIQQRYREEGIEQPLPLETESQRQGRDFDGDTIGVELASKYPNFTAEVKRRNWAGYAYAPTPKEKKISFQDENGSHWEFSRIAHFMADGMSVGFINNFVTATEALESEAELIIKQGDLDQKLLYLNQIVKHYRGLIQEEQKLAQNEETTPQIIRDKFRERVTTLAAFQTVADTNMAQIDEMIDLNRSIYREMIEEGCYQNQIAVDMFKSARSPNMDIIQNNQRLLYRQVNYIRDKKDPQIYTSRNNQPRIIEVNGFSPVELIINQTNEIFAESSLQARPTVQFRNLFAETYSPQQKKIAEQQKLEFDQAFNAATRLNRALNREKGPALAIVTHQGTSLTLSNIVQYKHPLVFAEDNTLNLQPLKNLRLVQNKQPEYPLLAQAQDKDNRWQNLGAISQTDCQQYNLVAGAETMVAEAVLQPGLDRETVKLQFSQTFEQLEAWSRTITDDSERAAMAAAAWHVGSSRESAEKADNADYKISNFSFYAFQNELCDRVATSAIVEFDLFRTYALYKLTLVCIDSIRLFQRVDQRTIK
ncbi:MAG: hypothetical protein SAJ72_07350 [Jaaginema sp. PMC 1080.18]|nr:hypothetical protein [Jaaginema sp. PMC 1080.18]MEC4867837.1 hypothetical protein [Jaaginema sp. PMC 1078.18]